MISLDNITYRYRGGVVALDSVTASLGSGIRLLLGENGAGKSTLLHVIAGLLKPRQGVCLLDGTPTWLRRPSTLASMFLLGDDMRFPASTINEFARIHSGFFPTFSPEVLVEALQAFGMSGDEPMERMSFGTRKKAQIAYALALQTPVLLLDEPANGLDIDSRKILRRLFSAYIRPEATVIVSTHSVTDFSLLYDGVIVLRRARVALVAETSWLLERLRFVISDTRPADAFYVESEMGSYRAVVPNPTGEILSDIDFSLLYSALMASDSLKQYLDNE